MIRTILILLLSLSFHAQADQVFGDEYMRGCIRGMIDFVGAVRANNVAIVKTCMCMQYEINRTTTFKEYRDGMSDNSSIFNQKMDDAANKCSIYSLVKHSASSP
jgi:hypothetical protein